MEVFLSRQHASYKHFRPYLNFSGLLTNADHASSTLVGRQSPEPHPLGVVLYAHRLTQRESFTIRGLRGENSRSAKIDITAEM